MYDDEFEDDFDELDEEREEGADEEEEETLEELQIDEDGHLKQRRRRGDEDLYETYDE